MYTRPARLMVLASAAAAIGACAPDRSAGPLPGEPVLATANGNAPSELTATAVSASAIHLMWRDDAASESGWEVYRSTTGQGGAFALVATTGTDVSAYHDTGLNPSSEYCYKVRAFRVTGKKTTHWPFSSVACVSTLATRPNAPAQTAARPAGSTTVDVSWADNSSNEAGFRVERSIDGASSFVMAGQTGTGATSFRDTGRSAEFPTVCYRVVAFNSEGDSDASPVDCTNPPAAPAGLAAAVVGDQAIRLTWTDASRVEDGYEVQRAASASGPYETVAQLSSNSTTVRDPGLADNSTYWYRVRATKDGGFSDWSDTVSATTVATLPPVAPSATSVRPWGLGMIEVSWVDNSSNEDGFRIERSMDGGAWGTVGLALPNQQGFSDVCGILYEEEWCTDGGVLADHELCYRVTAFNGAGELPALNVDCTVNPAPPTNLAASVVDYQTIDLTWTDVSAYEDGYELRCADTYSMGEFYPCGSVPASTTTLRLTGLEGGKAYWFQIRPTRDGGWGGFSNQTSATTPPAPEYLASRVTRPTPLGTWRYPVRSAPPAQRARPRPTTPAARGR